MRARLYTSQGLLHMYTMTGLCDNLGLWAYTGLAPWSSMPKLAVQSCALQLQTKHAQYMHAHSA